MNPLRHTRPRRVFRSAALALALALQMVWVTGCSTTPIASEKRMAIDRVPAAIESARALPIATASSEELEETIGALLRASRAELSTDQRVAVQTLLDAAATEFAARGEDPDALEALALADMPARIAVPAGLRAARRWIDDDERSDAFGVLRRLDERYPSHALSDEAGELLYEIGTSYRDDKRRRLFLFPYSNRAPVVFEYLSTEHPAHDKADDALIELANVYERERLYDLAIERHQDLILWARESPFYASSLAKIPMLRLDDLDGPEYARDQLKIALEELESWVARYGDHPLRLEVDRTMVDCLQRLADNDLVVAKFYRTVKNPDGARRHAARGLEFAERAGNDAQAQELLEFLASVDEIEAVDAPRILPESGRSALDSFDPAGTGTSTPTPLAPSEPLDVESRRRPAETAPQSDRNTSGDPPGAGDGIGQAGDPNRGAGGGNE